MNFKRFKKSLPDTYQELEYIQSGSTYLQTGYIDTGLVGTDLYGCEIETCMKVTAIISSNLYYLNGAYEVGHATQTGLIREDTEYVHSVVNMGFNSASYSSSIALNDWHTIYTSDGIQKTDGIIISNETYGTFNNLRYLLFARSDTGITLSPPFAMKYFWIKKNGQYIRNMIPAKRKSDNVVGMYDIANDVFYTNKNPYTFIGGSDVAPVWHDIPHYIHNTSTDTITTLSAVIYPTGTTATAGLKGNTVQNGTPTPDNPIMPQGIGERTENLFDVTDSSATANTIITLVDFGTNVTFDTITCSCVFDNLEAENTYGAFIDYPMDDGTHQYVALSGMANVNDNTGVPTNVKVNGNYYNTKRNITFRRIQAYLYTTGYNKFKSGSIKWAFYDSSKKDYEPFGVKIPISSANTTTPVYLGEVQTTRKIKKLVLDGNTSISPYSSGATGIGFITQGYRMLGNRILGISSHFRTQSTGAGSTIDGVTFGINNTTIYFTFSANSVNAYNLSDLASIRQYLAQQYAAGTPVTVWYVLAEPETAVVNEPLMKIGNYVDTVSDITIPTIAGVNTISVDTTIQPGEVTVNYKGWHPVHSVHEYGGAGNNIFDFANPNIANGYIDYNGYFARYDNNGMLYVPIVAGKTYNISGLKRVNTSIGIRWATMNVANPQTATATLRTGQYAYDTKFELTAENGETYLYLMFCGDSDYSAYGNVQNAYNANCPDVVVAEQKWD